MLDATNLTPPEIDCFECHGTGTALGAEWFASGQVTANLRTKILDFRGFDSSRILSFKGWNSHIHGEFPGSFESTNLSRDNLSRESGRSGHRMCSTGRRPLSGVVPVRIFLYCWYSGGAEVRRKPPTHRMFILVQSASSWRNPCYARVFVRAYERYIAPVGNPFDL